MRRPFARRRGFTLLEILLALAIAALLVIIGYRGLSQLLDSDVQLNAQSQRWRSLDQFFTRLEGDLRKAVPRGVRGPSGDEPAFWVANKEHDGRYTTALRISRAGGESGVTGIYAGQRLEYRLDGQAIELTYWPYLDNPAESASTTYTLLDGIASLRVRSFAPRGEWLDLWPPAGSTDNLPRAVRIELQLASGETLERWFTLQP